MYDPKTTFVNNTIVNFLNNHGCCFNNNVRTFFISFRKEILHVSNLGFKTILPLKLSTY